MCACCIIYVPSRSTTSRRPNHFSLIKDILRYREQATHRMKQDSTRLKKGRLPLPLSLAISSACVAFPLPSSTLMVDPYHYAHINARLLTDVALTLRLDCIIVGWVITTLANARTQHIQETHRTEPSLPSDKAAFPARSVCKWVGRVSRTLKRVYSRTTERARERESTRERERKRGRRKRERDRFCSDSDSHPHCVGESA